MQKDPKFRYASAQQTADVLDAWLTKYKALVPSHVGGGSSVSLGDEKEPRDGSGSSSSPSAFDTVSNQGGDTKSGSSITNLSTSDSGVLVKVSKTPTIADSSSQIDLQIESNLRTKPHSTARKNQLSQTATANAAKRPVEARALTPLPDATSHKVLWLVGLVIMFVFAVLLGVFIARFTEKTPEPSIEPQTSVAKPSFLG